MSCDKQDCGSEEEHVPFDALLSRARNGSDPAVGELLEQYREFLLVTAERSLESGVRGKVGASDLVQDSMIAAHQNFDGFRGETADEMRAWLKRILLNQYHEWKQCQKRQLGREVSMRVMRADNEALKDPEAISPSDIASQAEDAEADRQAMNRLPDNDRSAIELRQREPLDFQEIGEQLGRSTDEPGSEEHEDVATVFEEIEKAKRCALALETYWPNEDDDTIRGVGAPDGRESVRDVRELGSLGRFRIERLLGRGGMGNVFLAFDPTLERHLALKVPRFDVAGDPELRERFLKEARSAAKLSHPNLVEVYDAGLDGSICYIASAYCDGPDLADWLANQKGPVDPQLAAGLMAQLAGAMHYCHEMGIVHRDLKPANILLVAATDEKSSTVPGMPFVPKITDFGLAKVIEGQLSQTRSSLIVGTPLYMAPEQADGRSDAIGPATDIFALGVVFHELLFGVHPFESNSAVQLLDRLRSPEPVCLPRQPGVPHDLKTICLRCLAHDVDKRYPTANALAEDLARFLRSEPIHAKRDSLADGFLRWARHPKRLQDAGVGIILMQVVLTLWVLVGIVLADRVYEGAALNQTRIQGGMTIALFSIPLTILSCFILNGRRWAIPIALLIGLVGQTLLPAMILIGKVQMLEGLYDQQPYFEATNLSLIMICGIAETFLLAIAFFANWANPQRTR